MPSTTYLINQTLNQEFGAVSYSASPIHYIGLSTSLIDASGNTITEPTDASYARVAYTNDKSHWTNAESGSLVNSASAVFPQSSEAWGTIYSIFLADNSIGGSALYYYTATPAFPVMGNTVVALAEGTIHVGRT